MDNNEANTKRLSDESEIVEDNETITSLEFSEKGDYLASGHRNGKITLLNIDLSKKSNAKTEIWHPSIKFQSHEPEFDFLKSLEIEGKINQIKFCSSTDKNNYLISSNDKTIKLWKIGNKKKYLSEAVTSLKSTGQLSLPKLINSNSDGSNVSEVFAYEKHVFSSAHIYHINSLSVNNDNQTYISGDDLRINWWDLNRPDICFNVMDIKPQNMEELNEVITATQFHPNNCNILSFSTSRGAVKCFDTRESALCTSYCKVYSDKAGYGTQANKNFITDILNSISDFNYSDDGRYIVTRDYLSVKLWDTMMESKPMKTILLHEHLRPMLFELYSSDNIFDKFEVCCNSNGKSIATGSYNNQLKICNIDGKNVKTIDLPNEIETEEDSDANIIKTKKIDNIKSNNKQDHKISVDREERILHCTWHPITNTIGVAGKTGICLYKA